MGYAERYVEDYLRRRAKKDGFLCYKWTAPGTSGVPDDIVIGNGRVFFVECKATNGKLSELQKFRIREIEAHGAKVYVCYSREDIDEVLKGELGI